MTAREPGDIYEVWLYRYSPTGDPGEALRNVREEVSKKMRAGTVTYELRLAALEQFMMIWTEFVVTMLWTPELSDLGPETIVNRSQQAIEFLQLAALDQATELDDIANRKDGDS